MELNARRMKRVSARKKFMGGTPARRRRALSRGSGPPPENFFFRTPGDAFSEHLRA